MRKSIITTMAADASLFAALTLAFAANAETHYYINSATGIDSGSGTAAAPFKTIQYAMNKAPNADVVVHLAPGVYERATIVYKGEPATKLTFIGEGTDDNPVVIDGGGTNSCFTMSNANRISNFSNIIFRNGRRSFGGGICGYRSWGNLDVVSGVTNCVFENCTATDGSGGAIYSEYRSSSFKSCVFSNCTSSDGGGAVALSNAQGMGVFEDCTFINNTAGGSGGAVAFETPISATEMNTLGLVLTDCVFTNNSARWGGAIWGSVSHASNCEFVTNSAGSGGVWYYNGYKSQTYQGRHVVTNTFVDCLFEGNSAGGSGGAFGFTWAKRFSFDRCKFVGNSAKLNGSVLYGGALASLFVNDCLIQQNVGTNAIYVGYDGSSTLWGAEWKHQFHNSRFIGNDSRNGSAIENQSRVLVDGCEFAANVGGPVIHSLYMEQWRFTNVWHNCLFHHNTNAFGNAILYIFPYQGESAQVVNCTFVDNVTAGTPYAVYASDGWDDANQGCIYANLLVCGNVKTDGTVTTQVDKMLNARCVNSWLETNSTTITDGTRGNIVGSDPKFRDRAGGDYSLRASSPCRDSGVAFDWMAGALDIRNDPRCPRIVNLVPDMGCYEYIDYSGFKFLFR